MWWQKQKISAKRNLAGLRSVGMFQNRGKKKGFSLLEVLTAVLILAGLVALIAQISYGSRRRIQKTAQLEKISLLLEAKMLELKGEFQGSAVVKLPEKGEGEFEQDSNYSWSYRTQTLELPTVDLILPLLGLPDSSLNRDMVEIFKSVLSDTIVEIELTVFYQPPKRGKGINLSLSSYFINYEQAPDFILNQISQIYQAGRGSL